MEEVAESPEEGSDDELGDLEIPELDESLETREDDESIPTAEESVEETDAEEIPELSEADAGSEKRSSTSMDFDEAALDDEDDFDFLAGTDEAATKLDLARAYIEMGDADGARDILEEVSIEGSDDQKTEAKDLLKNLS